MVWIISEHLKVSYIIFVSHKHLENPHVLRSSFLYVQVLCMCSYVQVTSNISSKSLSHPIQYYMYGDVPCNTLTTFACHVDQNCSTWQAILQYFDTFEHWVIYKVISIGCSDVCQVLKIVNTFRSGQYDKIVNILRSGQYAQDKGRTALTCGKILCPKVSSNGKLINV